MFGWGKDKTIDAAAQEFIKETVSRSDQGYRIFIQDIIQILVDSGFGQDAGLGHFLNDERTKWYFTIGILAENLLAPPNLLSDSSARRFTDYAIEFICKSNRGPLPSKKIAKDIRSIIGHCIAYPGNSRLTILFYMLDNSGLEVSLVKEKIMNSPIKRLVIEGTCMSDGCMGSAKEIIEAHNLR